MAPAQVRIIAAMTASARIGGSIALAASASAEHDHKDQRVVRPPPI
jgi:hypothetical protein